MKSKPREAFLIYFLGMVMMLFIGILIYVYIEAKKANPIMLDEKGHPLASTLLPVAQALLPAGSRLISTPVGVALIRQASARVPTRQARVPAPPK